MNLTTKTKKKTDVENGLLSQYVVKISMFKLISNLNSFFFRKFINFTKDAFWTLTGHLLYKICSNQ